MEAALLISIFVALAVAICVPIVLSGKHWREAQEKARARRMAEHKINARLLRLDI